MSRPTVNELIKKLQEVVKENPEAGEYRVTMASYDRSNLWDGEVPTKHPHFPELQLEYTEEDDDEVDPVR